MRRLTLTEVNQRHGGILPPDAVLRPDGDLEPVRPAAVATPPARPRRGERFAALNTFVDFGLAAAGLKPAEAIVWLVLFRDTKADGTARTGQADIARRAGLDVRTVRRAVRALDRKGLLRTVRRGRLNAGPSVYRVSPTASP